MGTNPIQAGEYASLATMAWLSARILWAIWCRGRRGRPALGASADPAASALGYLRRWFQRDWEMPLSFGALALGAALFVVEIHPVIASIWIAVALSIFPAASLCYRLRPDLSIFAEADRAEGREKPERGRTFSSLHRNARAYQGLPQGERFRRELEARLANFDPWRASPFPARRALASTTGALSLLLILWGTARIWPATGPGRSPENIARAEEPAKKSEPEEKKPAEARQAGAKPEEKRPDEGHEDGGVDQEEKPRPTEGIADGRADETAAPPDGSNAPREDAGPKEKPSSEANTEEGSGSKDQGAPDSKPREKLPAGELARAPKKETSPDAAGAERKSSGTARGPEGKKASAPEETAAAKKTGKGPNAPPNQKGATSESPPAAAGKAKPKSAAECAHAECTGERKRGGA